jgi:hypothetical protein
LLWVSAIFITLSWSLPAKAEWKNSGISHANSKLTIISDTFNVSKISVRENANFYIEHANLTIGSRNAGMLEMQRLSRTNYCGFQSSTVWNLMAPGSSLEKQSLKVGGPSFAGERKGKRTHNNLFISYREGAGESLYCVVAAKVTGGNGCGGGGGNEFAYLHACIPKTDSLVSTFANSVTSTMHKLRTDRTGKDQITTAVTTQLSTSTPQPKKKATLATNPTKSDVKSRLTRLKEMVDEGLLTEDEAAAKRKKILDDL